MSDTEKEIDNGGPAFPSGIANGKKYPDQYGMTLRDYFAAKAMQGLMSGRWGDGCASNLNNHEFSTAHSIAQFAYAIADAMLKAKKS